MPTSDGAIPFHEREFDESGLYGDPLARFTFPLLCLKWVICVGLV